jgi:hypothetical protein
MWWLKKARMHKFIDRNDLGDRPSVCLSSLLELLGNVDQCLLLSSGGGTSEIRVTAGCSAEDLFHVAVGYFLSVSSDDTRRSLKNLLLRRAFGNQSLFVSVTLSVSDHSQHKTGL